MVRNWVERKETLNHGEASGGGWSHFEITAGPAMTQVFQPQLQEANQDTSNLKSAGSLESRRDKPGQYPVPTIPSNIWDFR